jgi:hypothetical protein
MLMTEPTDAGYSPWEMIGRREPALPLFASSCEVLPLVTIDDLSWFVYLYPLRILSAFDPRSLLHPMGRLVEPFVQFRARKRREIVMRRMMAAEGVGMTPDQAAWIARQFITIIAWLSMPAGMRTSCGLSWRLSKRPISISN